MAFRRFVLSVGVGAAGFLVASGIGFSVFGGDFPSVFYVLPLALASALVGAVGTYVVFGSPRPQPVRALLTGVAAFGYSVFVLWFVRYSIARTRNALSFDLIAIASVAVAVAVAALAWRSRPVADET
jgi:4-amino-4-deoxy-L-arabinose transferase-like glycosyltransferase